MADPTLSVFVKEALAAGRSRAEIAEALAAAGWSDDQARDALAAYADIAFPVPVPRPRRYGSAREAFLYIVFFSLLGMVAAQVGALAFGFIDYAFADSLARQSASARGAGLRWAISALLVGYPIFLYLGWRLAAKRRRDAERRGSRVRAWLTYVTLIFAAGALIGDLVAVVYQFLSGGLGARFLAKAGVVGLISGAILVNFMRDAESAKAGPDWLGRLIAILSTLTVAALIAWAFSIASGPDTARARLADEQRLSDLGRLSRLIDCHYSYRGETPASLDVMGEALDAQVRDGPVAPGCAEHVPADPETGASYGYSALGAGSYQLCAVFARGWPEADEDNSRRRALARAYETRESRLYIDLPYGAGEACFTLAAQRFEAVDDETP